MEYNAIFRFLFGDLTEAVVMMALREAGVEIVDFSDRRTRDSWAQDQGHP